MSVTLLSSDEKSFEVDKKVAEMSVMIKKMIEDLGEENEAIPLPEVQGEVIPIPEVQGETLEKIIEYCQHHVNDLADAGEDVWDTNFLNMDQSKLFELMIAANYLEMPTLVDTACKHVAGMMKGKTAQQLQDEFGIECDMSPEKQEAVKKEFAWALPQPSGN